MKKSIVLVLFFAAMAGTVSSQAIIEGGLNYFNPETITADDLEAPFEPAEGWHVGIAINIPGRIIGFRPSVRYTDATGISNELVGGLKSVQGKFNLSYVEVPLDFKVGLGRKVKPYIAFGPILRFPLESTRDDIPEAQADVTYAAGVGAGIDLRLGGLGLHPEITYTFQVDEWVDRSFEIGSATFAPDRLNNLNGVVLKVGISL